MNRLTDSIGYKKYQYYHTAQASRVVEKIYNSLLNQYRICIFSRSKESALELHPITYQSCRN